MYEFRPQRREKSRQTALLRLICGEDPAFRREMVALRPEFNRNSFVTQITTGPAHRADTPTMDNGEGHPTVVCPQIQVRMAHYHRKARPLALLLTILPQNAPTV